MACVCVIDDQAMMRDSLATALKAQDHRVYAFGTAHDALTDIRQRSFDVVITDLRLPGMDGVELLREMRRLGLDVPVVLMTAYASVPTAVEAMKLGAFDYIQKPFNPEELGILIELLNDLGLRIVLGYLVADLPQVLAGPVVIAHELKLVALLLESGEVLLSPRLFVEQDVHVVLMDVGRVDAKALAGLDVVAHFPQHLLQRVPVF